MGRAAMSGPQALPASCLEAGAAGAGCAGQDGGKEEVAGGAEGGKGGGRDVAELRSDGGNVVKWRGVFQDVLVWCFAY